MSSISTSWSTDANTKATATSSTSNNVSLDGTLTVAGTFTASGSVVGIPYVQQFGINNETLVAGTHHGLCTGMMVAVGASATFGTGTDPATSLDVSGTTDSTLDDYIATYWYVPFDATVTEVRALATTYGSTSTAFNWHVTEYTLDNSTNYGDLGSGTLIASSATVSGISADALKLSDAFTINSANLTEGRIVVVCVEVDDHTDRASCQVTLKYKAR